MHQDSKGTAWKLWILMRHKGLQGGGLVAILMSTYS